MSIYESETSVLHTFDENFIPEEQLQTQWAELIELKKIISEQYNIHGRRIKILDIGIGSCRVAKHLSGIPEIWHLVAAYDGIDNAIPCINISKSVIEELNIGDVASVQFLQAADIGTLQKKYDIIMTTWFTPGNFHPDDFPFETYDKSSNKLDLTTNEKFISIFSTAYNMLEDGGEIVLGSCYIDNDNTRKKQESFYHKIGMTVITEPTESFTATRERFWSQRFTKEKIFNYFSFVPQEKISFTMLDTYNYAMQVRIRK